MPQFKNLPLSAVATAPSPATSGTSLVVTTGHGTRFPDVPFMAVVGPANTILDPSNSEFIQVTAVSTDTLTIVRAQEGSSARTVVVGDQIAAVLTAGMLTGKTLSKTILQWPAVEGIPPATAFATLDTRNNVPVLNFDDTTQEEIIFHGIMPEGINLASGVKVLMRFMSATATSGNVRWGVQFERMNTDEDSDSFATAVENHGATNGTSGIVNSVTVTLSSSQIDGLLAGEPFRMKVYRDASDTTNDTVTGDAQLVSVELQNGA